MFRVSYRNASLRRAGKTASWMQKATSPRLPSLGAKRVWKHSPKHSAVSSSKLLEKPATPLRDAHQRGCFLFPTFGLTAHSRASVFPATHPTSLSKMRNLPGIFMPGYKKALGDSKILGRAKEAPDPVPPQTFAPSRLRVIPSVPGKRIIAHAKTRRREEFPLSDSYGVRATSSN